MKLLRDIRGSMAIETAIVAPVLILMTLGTFEVGSVVARQHELQSAANEAETIILATARGASVEPSKIQEILEDSLDLDEGEVVISREYRCNQNGRIKVKGTCGESAYESEYITISVTDTYVPTWTEFGVGDDIEYSVDRSVQIR